LLLAVQENDDAHTTRTIKKILADCTFGKLDLDGLYAADLDYLFVIVRNKSLGEGLELSVECESCKKKTQVQFNLEKVKVVREKEIDKKIIINDKITLIMKYPTVKDMENLSTNNIQRAFQFLVRCIEYVDFEGSLYDVKDYSEKEMVEYLEQMTQAQIDKIDAFVDSIPKLVFEEHCRCPSCGYDNRIYVEGLGDFFA
jgi:hypothetical protein